ncbi:hypothetical protein PAMP_008707 [Pampus punctatissimus]
MFTGVAAHSVLQARLLFQVYQCRRGNSSCCPSGTVILPSGGRHRARPRICRAGRGFGAEEGESRVDVCDCMKGLSSGCLVLSRKPLGGLPGSLQAK